MRANRAKGTADGVCRRGRRLLGGLATLALLVGCQHRVALEAPKEPIVINLNVKIEQEVRVKVEEDVEDLFEDNPDIF